MSTKKIKIIIEGYGYTSVKYNNKYGYSSINSYKNCPSGHYNYYLKNKDYIVSASIYNAKLYEINNMICQSHFYFIISKNKLYLTFGLYKKWCFNIIPNGKNILICLYFDTKNKYNSKKYFTNYYIFNKDNTSEDNFIIRKFYTNNQYCHLEEIT